MNGLCTSRVCNEEQQQIGNTSGEAHEIS
jgi:hypothetical protein